MSEKMWFYDLNSEDAKEARTLLRDKVITLLALILGLGMILVTSGAMADPWLRADNGQGLVITIHSEDCKLKHEITNLKHRAVWVENGKKYEGCAGPTPYGLVLMYFSGDKTVAIVPVDVFVPVAGT